MTPAPENPPELLALRQKIDALDDAIIALIKQRCGVVAEVGEWKKKRRDNGESRHNIRPGREAEMIRRLVKTFAGSPFPPEAAAAIWRLLITASTTIETELSISVYAGPGHEQSYWLAREYFGSFLPITRHASASRVLADVMEGKVSMAVLPAPQSEGPGDWWQMMPDLGEKAPRVFAHLPFLYPEKPGRDDPAALALGKVLPEPTGDDITLLALRAGPDVSTHRLQTSLSGAGLKATWLAVQQGASGHARLQLVQLRGCVAEGDPSLEKALAELGKGAVTPYILGSYAAPLPPPRRQETNHDSTAKSERGRPTQP